MPRPSLPAIAALRYFAALGVVAFHFQGLFGANLPWPLAALASNGFVGVNLFFVLSGFVLAYVYRAPGGGLAGSRRAFWIARAARILPVYFLAWAAMGALEWGLAGLVAPEKMRAAALSAALLQAWIPGEALGWNSPGWSLSVEALFYLAFPWLVGPVARSRRPWAVFGGAWALALLVPLPFGLADGAGLLPPALGTWRDTIPYFPPLHLGSFVAGIALGVLFLEGRLAWLRGPWWGAAIAAALFGAGVWSPGPFHLAYHNGLLLPLFALLVGYAANLTRAPRWLIEAGEASYSLYILQFPLWQLWHLALRGLGARLDGKAGLLAFTVAATLASWAVLVAFERPARDLLRRRFAAARTPAPAAGAVGPGPA